MLIVNKEIKDLRTTGSGGKSKSFAQGVLKCDIRDYTIFDYRQFVPKWIDFHFDNRFHFLFQLDTHFADFCGPLGTFG